MSKTYEDGLKDALGELEDVYAEYSPIHDFSEEVRAVVDETYRRVNLLISLPDDIYRGIRFAVSRMGLQFNTEQEEKYARDICAEYLHAQERKENCQK